MRWCRRRSTPPSDIPTSSSGWVRPATLLGPTCNSGCVCTAGASPSWGMQGSHLAWPALKCWGICSCCLGSTLPAVSLCSFWSVLGPRPRPPWPEHQRRWDSPHEMLQLLLPLRRDVPVAAPAGHGVVQPGQRVQHPGGRPRGPRRCSAADLAPPPGHGDGFRPGAPVPWPAAQAALGCIPAALSASAQRCGGLARRYQLAVAGSCAARDCGMLVLGQAAAAQGHGALWCWGRWRRLFRGMQRLTWLCLACRACCSCTRTTPSSCTAT